MGNRTFPHPDTGFGGRVSSAGPLATFMGDVWHPTGRNRRQQVSLPSVTIARRSDFHSPLPQCCSFDGPDEGASEWRRKRKARGFVRPMTTDRAPVSRSIRAFSGLQKPSADSSLASRPSLQPPPMTTNRGHDRDRFFSYNFICLARLHRCRQTPGSKRAGTERRRTAVKHAS
jgi:hypothetical protein